MFTLNKQFYDKEFIIQVQFIYAAVSDEGGDQDKE